MQVSFKEQSSMLSSPSRSEGGCQQKSGEFPPTVHNKAPTLQQIFQTQVHKYKYILAHCLQQGIAPWNIFHTKTQF